MDKLSMFSHAMRAKSTTRLQIMWSSHRHFISKFNRSLIIPPPPLSLFIYGPASAALTATHCHLWHPGMFPSFYSCSLTRYFLGRQMWTPAIMSMNASSAQPRDPRWVTTPPRQSPSPTDTILAAWTPFSVPRHHVSMSMSGLDTRWGKPAPP